MISDILNAIRAYPRAFRKIAQLRLWHYFIIPGLISLIFGSSIYKISAPIANRFDDWLVSFYPWEWGSGIIETASYWIGMILVWGGALIIYKHLILVLSSPFMTPMAQAIEDDWHGQTIDRGGFSLANSIKGIIRGLRVALRNIIRELFFTLLLMLLSAFIPVIGVFISVLIFLIQAYYAGFGNMDYILEGHYGVRGSAAFVKRNKGLAIGNGIVFLGLIFTIVGVLIAPPLATVAAALETVPRLKD